MSFKNDLYKYNILIMKGVILAGGRGTRLFPCTSVINKHLLPIYDQPMIFYPIQTLVKAGCKNLLIILGGESIGDMVKLIGNGSNFGLESIYYVYQEKPNGIADALLLAKNFIGNDKFCLILGDNLIFEDLSQHWINFKEKQFGTAMIFIKEVDNPISFGVAETKGDKIVNIIEKPINPITNFAVVGVYMYDHNVFDIIKNIKPSSRGELEITDVNNAYIINNQLYHIKLNSNWIDTGNFLSLLEANNIVAKIKADIIKI